MPSKSEIFGVNNDRIGYGRIFQCQDFSARTNDLIVADSIGGRIGENIYAHGLGRIYRANPGDQAPEISRIRQAGRLEVAALGQIDPCFLIPAALPLENVFSVAAGGFCSDQSRNRIALARCLFGGFDQVVRQFFDDIDRDDVTRVRETFPVLRNSAPTSARYLISSS